MTCVDVQKPIYQKAQLASIVEVPGIWPQHRVADGGPENLEDDPSLL